MERRARLDSDPIELAGTVRVHTADSVGVVLDRHRALRCAGYWRLTRSHRLGRRTRIRVVRRNTQRSAKLLSIGVALDPVAGQTETEITDDPVG